MLKSLILISSVFLIAVSVCTNCANNKNSLIFKVNSEKYQFVSHKEWGWEPATFESEKQTINKITIHHGEEEFSIEKDPIEYLRNLQSWSRTEKNWPDIPYHYMIDLKGTIYEARPIQYPGDTNTDYDVRGHALICVMGNYEIQKINTDQLNSLIYMTANIANKYSVSVDDIKGHKDYTETACPGGDLYRYLEDCTIQDGVKLILEGMN